MSYYWFNREKILKNVWDKYHKKEGEERAAKYYVENREILKDDARNGYRSLTKTQKRR